MPDTQPVEDLKLPLTYTVQEYGDEVYFGGTDEGMSKIIDSNGNTILYGGTCGVSETESIASSIVKVANAYPLVEKLADALRDALRALKIQRSYGVGLLFPTDMAFVKSARLDGAEALTAWRTGDVRCPITLDEGIPGELRKLADAIESSEAVVGSVAFRHTGIAMLTGKTNSLSTNIELEIEHDGYTNFEGFTE